MAALDCTGIGDRQAVHILAALRVDDAKANNIALLRSNVQKARKKQQSGKAAYMKKTFRVNGPLVAHFDVKLLPAINSLQEKEECVAILVSNF